ncbi:MAG: hypothetical protein K0R45_101 [Pseudomonas sp.]|nr:hypothetical protein [Pseudomonas sp.]
MGRKTRPAAHQHDRTAAHYWDALAFLARYFPSFITTIFMCIFSIVLATVLVTQAWFSLHPQRGVYSIAFLLSASAVLTCGGFLLSRGRLWAMWILVGILVSCLLAVLPNVPTHAGALNKILYTLGLIFPLLGLLSLNSRRSREMREQMLFNRSMRASLRDQNRQRDAHKRDASDLSNSSARRKKASGK